MKISVRSLLLGSIAFCFAITVRAEMSPEKEALLRRMVEATQMLKAFEMIKPRLLQSIASGRDVSPEFVRRFSEKLTAERLLKAFLPVYDRYYTNEDCEAIIAFYTSPAGTKLATNQAAIAAEIGNVARPLGVEIAKEVVSEMQPGSTESSPNQAAQSTTSSVTPPAGQEARQP
jgi:hypothetical protein